HGDRDEIVLDTSPGARVEDVAVHAIVLREIVPLAAARKHDGEPIRGQAQRSQRAVHLVGILDSDAPALAVRPGPASRQLAPDLEEVIAQAEPLDHLADAADGIALADARHVDLEVRLGLSDVLVVEDLEFLEPYTRKRGGDLVGGRNMRVVAVETPEPHQWPDTRVEAALATPMDVRRELEQSDQLARQCLRLGRSRGVEALENRVGTVVR